MPMITEPMASGPSRYRAAASVATVSFSSALICTFRPCTEGSATANPLMCHVHTMASPMQTGCVNVVPLALA